MPEQRSSAGQSFPADTLTRSSEGTSSEDRMSPSGMMSESQLWEEGGRLAEKASQMTPPQGPAIRQVVDLSPPENTAVAEFPVANGLLSTLPNPGKQELAGSESARTGTAAQSTEQESASSDSVFANVCFVSAVGDSQVKGPLSLRQAHSTGKMSVETQGRRQAGNVTRAGSATPPNPSLAQAVEMKPGGSPAGEKPVMPMMSESQFWGEGRRLAGKASQMTPPQGPATRQVVDLSPPENTAVAELPVANGLLSTLPNPGKQEPAGSESARTGTAAQSTEQESASVDSVFANVCFVSAVGDSQVKGPLSLRQAHSTGNMSVETQGRRQAGNDTRAGSATPPNPSLAQAVEMKSGGSPAGGKPVMPGKQGPAIPEEPLRPERTQQGDRPVHNLPFIFVPGAIEPRKNRPDKGETLPSAEVFLSEVPPPAQRGNNFDFKAPQTTSRPAKQNSEPQVQIGLLEVVVVSPGQSARAGQSKENISSNLASRFYLRNV